MTQQIEFESCPDMPNQIARGTDFCVSFNPNTDCGPETALVNYEYSRIYLILLGDFREEYLPLIPLGYAACKEFFDAKPESMHSPWSD